MDVRSPYSRVHWWRKKLASDQERRVVDRFCEKGGTAVDVGAARGVLAMGMARRVGRKGWLYLFEPNMEYRPLLRRRFDAAATSIRSAAWTRARPAVHLFSYAASDRKGEAILRVPVTAGSPVLGLGSLEHGDGDPVTVQTLRLDDNLPPWPIGFLKIDVEGHELAVLRGAAEVLQRTAAVLVEVEERHLPDGVTVDDVFGFLSAAGFDGYALFPDGLHPLDPHRILPGGKTRERFSVEQHQHGFTPNEQGGMGRGYVNNFLWVRPEDHRTERLLS